jgi:hypothetical protein
MLTLTHDRVRSWNRQYVIVFRLLFVVNQGGDQQKKPVVREQAHDDIQSHRHHLERIIVLDALWELACSFTRSWSDSVNHEFLKAYVHGGTVVNPHSVQRSQEEDIHIDNFLQVNRGSHRSALMPRDYIFATMPSFPWYAYPKRQALEMSFGEIYLDLYQQAGRSGHAFTCRFTSSMVHAACTDPINGWLPSQHLPSPTTLGDFMKLLGQRVPENSNASSRHVHVTSVVRVEEFECQTNPDIVIKYLESLTRLFPEQWDTSHRGGELSRYGNDPSHDWILDPDDTMKCGWVPTDPEHAVRMHDYNDQTPTTTGTGLGFEEDDVAPNPASLDEIEDEFCVYEPGDPVPLFVQGRKILNLMWCSKTPDGGQTDWNRFHRVQADWDIF